MKITKTSLDAMKFAKPLPTAKDLRWDDEVPGFGVRVWPSGKKTFFVNYRYAGKERYKTIGPYGVLTLQQARDKARLAKVQLLAGLDPSAKREAIRDGKGFGDFAADYIKRHADRKKSRKDDVSILELHILPEWRGRVVADLKRADVATLHHKIGKKTPIRANRALSLLSKMFNLARDWGYVPENHANPATGIERYKENQRERFVSMDEMRKLGAAIEQEENLFGRAAIWAYLLTGMRKAELLKLKWTDVDFRRKEIRKRDTKAGRTHILPLTSHMETLLGAVPRMSDNPYVFCGRGKGQKMSHIQGPWERVRKAAGLEDVWLHDLRRTVGSWLVNSGASLPLIGSVLDHSNPSTTQRYARFQTAAAAAALEEHGNQLQMALVPEVAHGSTSGSGSD